MAVARARFYNGDRAVFNYASDKPGASSRYKNVYKSVKTHHFGGFFAAGIVKYLYYIFRQAVFFKG